jgi:hypothetical protein
MTATSYADDLALMSNHTDVLELKADHARVAIAPGFQARVMTSTVANGLLSFGWINEEFIRQGLEDPAFNNYGGEDRFWLGPEAGQFGLWFAPDEPFDTAHWKTPEGFGSGAWSVLSADDKSVRTTRDFDVANRHGTRFACKVNRTIRLLGEHDVSRHLGCQAPDGLSMVAFESTNELTNAGPDRWTRTNGLVSIWILGMFKPLPRGRVIVPIVPGDRQTLGPKVTTDYFGSLPDARGRLVDDCFLFACDGQYRSKIGVSPARAVNVLGSYDPDGKVLTIVQYSLPDNPTAKPWVNSLWEQQDHPYAGDVVNSYNDGPPDDPAETQLGPFYELETSSPAAELAAGDSISHAHRTFHFAGEPARLNDIARRVLSFDLGSIDWKRP